LNGQCYRTGGGEIGVFPAGASDVRDFAGAGREGGDFWRERGQELGGSRAGHEGWKQDRCDVLEASFCQVHLALFPWQCR